MVDIAISAKQNSSREDRASQAELENGFKYAGVFDGHNGVGAAAWCGEYFPHLLNEQYRQGESTVGALHNAFRVAHDSIQGDSGTTATVVITQGHYVAVAHVGDSRAVLCHGDSAVTLTEDHKLSWDPEYQRILEAQTTLGNKLILGKRVQGLMLTRSIGDKSLTSAIIPDPVVHQFTRTEQDDFLIVASDGLWDVCSGQDVISHIRSRELRSASEIADSLVFLAEQAYGKTQLKRDDITCCVISFL